MKIKLRAFLLLCFAFNAFNIWAIETQVPDTGLILTKDAFLAIVKQYHPIMAQANITVEKANSQILTARGGFDPLFNNKDYYNYNAINLTIPTWYGLDINAGTEYVDGYYANPEKSQGQSSYIGVKLPLGNGLLFDKRRAALRQAQAMQQLAEADRRLAVNNLIYESISTYLNWQKEYNQLLIVNELVQNNIERIKIIKTEFGISKCRLRYFKLSMATRLYTLQQHQ
ncbi:MAG: hypothetical protein EBX41_07945 [Chitinophagia bacterium]|nr:hypothetical protein [Chitinophagia bacterium]